MSNLHVQVLNRDFKDAMRLPMINKKILEPCIHTNMKGPCREKAAHKYLMGHLLFWTRWHINTLWIISCFKQGAKDRLLLITIYKVKVFSPLYIPRIAKTYTNCKMQTDISNFRKMAMPSPSNHNYLVKNITRVFMHNI